MRCNSLKSLRNFCSARLTSPVLELLLLDPLLSLLVDRRVSSLAAAAMAATAFVRVGLVCTLTNLAGAAAVES